MNVLEAKQEIGRLLNDPNNERWNSDVLIARINLAQKEIVGLTNCIKTQSTTYTPTANQETVEITTFLDILDVTIQRSNGDVVPLIGISRQELDYRYPNWRQWDPGEPQYWWYAEFQGSTNTQEMHLVPKPDANNAITDGLGISGVIAPRDVDEDSDSMFNGISVLDPYKMSIVHWVVAQCFLDDATPEAIAKSKVHRTGDMLRPGLYESQIARILQEFDRPSGKNSRILWKKEGGRIGSFGPSKAYPLI